ncbi:hypothetical protein CWC12_12260 [Pseudoalteromonas ruthenica]|uniref:Uncharacterized protein n=1 Tax=Pseudoalteromonas ruthenica TaxID=151081 RepID=A0A0F4PWQ0_9GAMM|nr:hypothetical protein TW76_16440 [Pseudoalteromonas ruthenica]KJY98726.1 hypothetical protein TW72_13485 [Pseudoalteromonas ruthenica]TMO87020.1 hypothetical protein CWC12_12260 [Pseudoalteromonas ruthenica]TMO93718.1 hypothetical protein CWC13_05545 [Pseudoalteromonas ruthenica]TMO97530.1 hypothetical protein CWC07_13695 [Pseudoalteromonas ruthenica]
MLSKAKADLRRLFLCLQTLNRFLLVARTHPSSQKSRASRLRGYSSSYALRLISKRLISSGKIITPQLVTRPTKVFILLGACQDTDIFISGKQMAL